MREGEESEFTVLENKKIGRNFYMFRKLTDTKALEVAEYLGIKEATYTKYERGESKITVDLVQKVSEFFNIDPLQLISAQPSNYVEAITGSNNIAIQTNSIYKATDAKQTEVMMKMMETMLQMNEAIRKILEGK
ncbi:helix-turn-helix domain-containing protein [Algoriphagus sp. D3-2-R+10]|uniref:helix-turn-helix domain-containing protein n=1 Tax=Algoriphagus aurantiacus TaxID=3103948 RepID=UPI002B374197|nr:helix-turn-helix domain-containing protein [Algoriphagus sp. D3-2-R+10]MEB2778398.1 helix-turn-helix domain-containing protein [Algoriphagus sp. D3-2-R+10]